MNAVIDAHHLENDVLDIVRDIKYRLEGFFKCAAIPMADDEFPAAEMLALHEDGKSAGHVFDDARKSHQTVAADLIALGIAIDHHVNLGQPTSSINLNVETFFDTALIPRLNELQAQNPKFDPRKIWLEITEQGGVPSNSNTKFLADINDMGYRLALDDYDLNNPKEHERLDIFGPFVKAVKLDHTFAETFRSGTEEEKNILGQHIHSIKDEFPQMIIVLEGVRGTDMGLFPKLLECGVQVVQESGYCGDGPVKPIDRQEFELALHR